MNNLTKGILFIAFTTPALAAESKFSAELLLGTADQESEINGFGSISGDDTSMGVRGVFTLNENVAFELAFQDYGEMSDSFEDEFGDTINDKVSTDAINFGAKGIIPLGNGLSLNGRVGLSLWDTELKETDSSAPGQVFSADDDGNDLYFGLGAQYAINRQVNIGIEYTMTEMDVSILGISVDHEVKNLSLSVGVAF